MTPLGILAAIMILPVLVLMFLRINAALVFLSLCLGNVLVQFIAPDTDSLMSLISDHFSQAGDASSNTIKLVLLLLPVVLTAIFMIKSVKGRGKLALNLLPALGVGLLGALLVVPLLPGGVRHDIITSDAWSQIQHAQTLIVGGSAVVCLIAIWLQRPKHHSDKHGKH